MAEKQTEKAKAMEAFDRNLAIVAAETYFENVKSSLRRQLEEVERYEKHWHEVLEGIPYSDGQEQPKEYLVDILYWTVNSVQQFNPYNEKAVKAAASLAKTFDIKGW